MRRVAAASRAAGVAAALLLAGAAAPAVAADIYRCVDDDGVVHFSNAPTSDCFERVIKVETVRPEPPPTEAAAQAAGRAAGLTRYVSLIADAARRHRVEPALLTAMIRAESNFDPAAVSRRGALGLMQLMPATATFYGLADPFEPQANIDCGARHLRALLDRYDGDLHLALAAYNAGEQAVERYGRRVPPFDETRGYVRVVLRHLDAYRGGRTLTARR